MANSFQLDHYHSKLNRSEYNQYAKNMPSLPCFTNGEEPIEHARKIVKVLHDLKPVQHASAYFPYWLHNTLAIRPLYYIDSIDESVFGGDPPNPRLIQPKNANATRIAPQNDPRQDFYLTGFDIDYDPSEIQKGLKLITREVHDILARSRIMNLFMGKWTTVKIINSQTLEVEVHTTGSTMQFGIQNSIRDHFLKKAPRNHSVYHFGSDIPSEEYSELTVVASQ